jgi:hypothetical protein
LGAVTLCNDAEQEKRLPRFVPPPENWELPPRRIGSDAGEHRRRSGGGKSDLLEGRADQRRQWCFGRFGAGDESDLRGRASFHGSRPNELDVVMLQTAKRFVRNRTRLTATSKPFVCLISRRMARR